MLMSRVNKSGNLKITNITTKYTYSVSLALELEWTPSVPSNLYKDFHIRHYERANYIRR